MTDKKQQTILDCKNTFSTVSGLRFLDHLKVFCGAHINQDNFDRQSTTQTAYNLGRNRVYRYILSLIECDLGDVNAQDCIFENETGE